MITLFFKLKRRNQKLLQCQQFDTDRMAIYAGNSVKFEQMDSYLPKKL